MFRRFEDTAVKAYLILRQNANLFINLFSMVRPVLGCYAVVAVNCGSSR